MISYRLIISLLLMILTVTSCKKLFCKDEKMTLKKQTNTSALLRLDGYYENVSDPLNRDDKNVFLLYGNGVFRDAFNGEGEALSDSKMRLEYKSFWGLYVIDGNKIFIERWSPKPCGGVGLVAYEGEILNDTTFTITHWKFMRKGKVDQEADANAVFHFVHFAPKPDSSVTFF